MKRGRFGWTPGLLLAATNLTLSTLMVAGEPAATDVDRIGPRGNYRSAAPLASRMPGGTWVFQGPAPTLNGQVENVGNTDSVSGAVHTVLAHPTDPDRLWLGAANGGIWSTTNATVASPTWTPLTDTQPSLATGALAFDPTDGTFNTIVAGVGRYSSYGRGRMRGGVLRTIDGGASWTSLDGGGTLSDKSLSGVAARGSTIVVSTNTSSPSACNSVGIYRSVDGGASFSQIAVLDAVGTGLPLGVFFDLAEDPSSTSTLYTSVASADVCNNTDLDGIYKSIDTGATWTKVSSAAMDALIADTSNIEISVGNSNQVYVGIVNTGQLAGLFRSGNDGTSWVQLDTPVTNEGGFPIGIQPRPKDSEQGAPGELIAGTQGRIHFSLIADPANADLVYVGGDRQPTTPNDSGSFPNSLGANTYSGRLFRVDASLTPGSQATTLTHCQTTTPSSCDVVSTTLNSAPHADSREMVFDANGNLIEVDDGGIYRRTNPQGVGDWFSMMGSLGTAELHDAAYDTNSNIIIGGAQDTGTPEQITSGGTTWDSVATADGGDVAVDVQSLSGSSQSVRYSSFQFLIGFRRLIYDAANGFVGFSFPSLTPLGGSPPLSGQFVTPIEINAIDPLRLAFSANNGIYESFDGGTTITRLAPVIAPNFFDGDPVAYGGRKGAVDNQEVLYVADVISIYVRTGVGPMVLTSALPGSPSYVTDIVLDPDDWETAYVSDLSGAVFVTTDAGVAWTEITGNLPSLTLGFELHAIEFVPSLIGDAIYVGGAHGVFQMLTSAPGVWTEYGTGLPEMDVWDLDYDPDDDVMLAATLGRGAWLIAGVSGVECGSGCDISGAVRYYRDSLTSSEPSAKPVPEMDVDLLEDGQPAETTDSAGDYAFPGQIGARTVTVLDEFGAPRAAHHNGAIDPFDAAFIAGAAIGEAALSVNQELAGDVSGNGSLSAFDAGMVNQFAAGLVDHFPVSTTTGSDWAFLRCDNYVDASNQDCTTSDHVFNPLDQDETATDYYAILYGDATGSWQPSARAPAADNALVSRAEVARLRSELAARSAVRSDLATLRLEGARGQMATGEQRQLLARIDDPEGILALDLTLGYDPRMLRVVEVATAGVGSELNLASRTVGGQTRLALFGLLPLDTSGTLLVITVEALEATARGVELELSGQANEGGIQLRILDSPRRAPQRQDRATPSRREGNLGNRR